MKIKREPLLVDNFLAESYNPLGHSGLVPPKYFETTRDYLRLAKRFVFDIEATRYCAQLIHDAPRIIADAQDFAIPPFEYTYIEIDFLTWWRTLTGREPDSTADTRAGYLIVKNEVRCISESKGPAGGVGLSPIMYYLNKPFTVQEEIGLVQQLGCSRMMLDLFYWGQSAMAFSTPKDGVNIINPPGVILAHENDRQWEKEGLRSLRANHSFKMWTAVAEKNLPGVWDKFYDGSAGDLRNIIGLLLFLNRTSKTRYETEVGMQPGRFIGRRQTNFLAHRVISFKINPLPRLIKLVAGEGVRKRLHDVRGHFCHNKEARYNGHDHDWIESAEKDLQWYCECGGLRWWRKQHERGHTQQGSVLSEYQVKG